MRGQERLSTEFDWVKTLRYYSRIRVIRIIRNSFALFAVIRDISDYSMKTGIHPTYYPKARVSCACGTTYTVGSTKERIQVEICANCHPFYTGQEKLIDTAGKVEKFRAQRAKASAATAKPKKLRVKKKG